MHEAVGNVPGFIQAIEPFVHQYGYLAVGLIVFVEGFGIPMPGQTMIVVAAFLAGLGQLDIWLVMAVAALAAILGDNVGYAIGKFGGHPLVEKYGKYIFVTKPRMDRVEEFFSRRGGWIVVFARFIDFFRQLNGIIAGISEMRWRNFLIFNIIGGVSWVVAWSMVGFFGGDYIDDIYRYGTILAVAGIAAAAGFIIFEIVKSKKHASESKKL